MSNLSLWGVSQNTAMILSLVFVLLVISGDFLLVMEGA